MISKAMAGTSGVIVLAAGLTGVFMVHQGEETRRQADIKRAAVVKRIGDLFTNAESEHSWNMGYQPFVGHDLPYRDIVEAEAQRRGFTLCLAYGWAAPGGLKIFAGKNREIDHGTTAAFAFLDDPDPKAMKDSAGSAVIYGKPCTLQPR